MKAVVIYAYGGPEQLKFEERPDPTPGPSEVLVRVVATSVNPFDLKIRSGSVKYRVPLTFPAILGLDVAGVVAAVGSGVKNFGAGERVFGQGMQTYASQCVVKAADLAKIPDSLETKDVIGAEWFSSGSDHPEFDEALGGCDDRVLAGPWSPCE